MNSSQTAASWTDSVRRFMKPTVITMLFYGFSAGLPIFLIFSSLSLWLAEAGVDKSAVTFFSWAALGYSFKFIWAPLVDRLPLPALHRLLGQRRSWILLAQIGIILSIVGMASTNPVLGESALTMMAVFAVLLGFTSATQDIAIDAFRIESDTVEMQALLSATYIAGYRIGMLASGAGALVMAEALGSTKDSYNYAAWQMTYLTMAGIMLVGVATTLLAKEPKGSEKRDLSVFTNLDYAKFLSLFLFVGISFALSFFMSADFAAEVTTTLSQILGAGLAGFIVEVLRFSLAILAAVVFSIFLLKIGVVNRGMVNETYIDPVKDFFKRYGHSVAILLLTLVGLYRISDIVLGVIANLFYQDLGYSKSEIAFAVKAFGIGMTILGGFLGGVLTIRFGVIRILFWGAALSALTNVLFMILAQVGYNLPLLYVVISADNLAGGLATTAFVAFLSSLTNVSFTAMQYAIFSSLMTLLPKLLGGYSGTLSETLGYPKFFAITALMGLPVLLLVHLASKRMDIKDRTTA